MRAEPRDSSSTLLVRDARGDVILIGADVDAAAFAAASAVDDADVVDEAGETFAGAVVAAFVIGFEPDNVSDDDEAVGGDSSFSKSFDTFNVVSDVDRAAYQSTSSFECC